MNCCFNSHRCPIAKLQGGQQGSHLIPHRVAGTLGHQPSEGASNSNGPDATATLIEGHQGSSKEVGSSKVGYLPMENQIDEVGDGLQKQTGSQARTGSE
jgi:hypothetical protein